MNIKFFTSIAAAVLLCSSGAYAQMMDEQVVAYVKAAVEEGKSKKRITQELMAKGVSSDQVKRLIKAYQNGEYEGMEAAAAGKQKKGKNEQKEKRGQVASIEANPFDKPIEDVELQNKKSNPLNETIKKIETIQDTIEIFGHNVFRKKNLSFEPNENAATPPNYVIGPGDELVIEIWGENEVATSYTVTPEGTITIPQIGPVQLSGLTVKSATSRLKAVLSKKYSLTGENPGSRLSVTLGNLRTVKVNILGEVITPGTYRLSSFSTIFNALYHAGGVTEIGSVRNVKLVRNGKTVATSDLYRFIFDGSKDGSVTLCDGDAIIVPTYTAVVNVTGGVKRPMRYEIVNSDGVDRIIEYAGGFTFNAYKEDVIVYRKTGSGGNAFSVSVSNFSSFRFSDGDKIVVNENRQNDLMDNVVKISGAVVRPGEYAIGSNVATLRQLIRNAGGVLDEAFLNRAQIVREKPDRTMELLSVSLGEILAGRSEDILLRKNDVVIISDKNKIYPKGDVSISGFVANPGDFKYAEGMTVEDVIMLAGGLEPGASFVNVEVARRVLDNHSLSAKDTIATIYKFNLNEDFKTQPEAKFSLMPFDVISVRKSPTYQAQKRVMLSGEVPFPGEYTLMTNHETISDVFKRAGGATPHSYIQGAFLLRKMSDIERSVRKINKIASSNPEQRDTLTRIRIPDVYTVGINLDMALKYPGGYYDVVLRDGDELVIPSMTTTVSIQGEVFYPNAVNFHEGKSVSYYINQAGGFTSRSKRRDVFVVYMNGKVERGMSAKVTPGCEIVVPCKEKSSKLNASEWIGIGTASASLATMIVSLVNAIKK